ncbi:Zinc finger C2HC domain-containing protein 1C [Terramyces sp. JEL0728]|nr:Zinc finger C2HC domain-containing protein 1C [Terramyces sp. JEL0728]
MNSHMRSCHGTSINAIDNDIFDYPIDNTEKQQVPASAPARRSTKVVDSFTNFEREKERVAAVAAESALGNQNGILPKKRILMKNKLSMIPSESSRARPSSSHSVRPQKKNETKSVELVAKRKPATKPARELEGRESQVHDRDKGEEHPYEIDQQMLSNRSRSLGSLHAGKLENGFYNETPLPSHRNSIKNGQHENNTINTAKISKPNEYISQAKLERVNSLEFDENSEFEESYHDKTPLNAKANIYPVAKLDVQTASSSNASKKAPHSAFHEDPVNELLDVSEYLVTCHTCSRKFMENRIEKHLVICENANSKKRKVFDIKLSRVQGTELEKYALKKKDQHEEPPKPKKSNWRIKHEAFMHMVISARQPKGSAPPLPADPNPDYVQCPTCDRRFNEDSGKRHIPLCKERVAKKAMERPSAGKPAAGLGGKDKAEELKRRTAYKPPSPRKLKK